VLFAADAVDLGAKLRVGHRGARHVLRHRLLLLGAGREDALPGAGAPVGVLCVSADPLVHLRGIALEPPHTALNVGLDGAALGGLQERVGLLAKPRVSGAHATPARSRIAPAATSAAS